MTDDPLKHHGVKGMHWGVRNEDDTGGGSSSGGSADGKSEADSLAEYKGLTASQKPLKGLAASKKLAENKAKAVDKLNDPGPVLPGAPKDAKRIAKAAELDAKAGDHDARIKQLTAQRDALGPGMVNAYRRSSLQNTLNHEIEARDAYLQDAQRVRDGKLTSGQRKALIAASVGAVVVGGLAYSAHAQNAKVAGWEKAAAAGDTDAKLKLYQHQVFQAQAKTWMMGGFVQPSSWDREEFELPAGHTFHRISTRDETGHGYSDGTYCTPDEADFNRYVAGFRQEKGPGAEFHHVTFTTKTPTKVPNLHTTVETLREQMQKGSSIPITRELALAKYQEMSGGDWKGLWERQLIAGLKEKGYGAIIDEMDAGVIGERPLVFFDQHNANPKSARALDQGEIVNREKSVQLMSKPPRKA